MRSMIRGVCGLVLLALALFLVSGCLEGDKTVDSVYDPAKDEFSVLVVYQRIRGGTPNQGAAYEPQKDLAHLNNLYLNRDHLILDPFAGLGPTFQVLGEAAWLRINDREAAVVNLGNPSAESQVIRPGAPLDRVRIKPGGFFLRAPDNLCYWHEMVFPGAVADALLPRSNAVLAATLSDPKQGALKGLDDELVRREDGGAAAPWPQWKAAILEQIATRKPADAMPAGWPLEVKSMVLLRTAMTQKKIALERRKDRVLVQVPMTEADGKQIISLVDDIVAAASKRLKAGATTQPGEDRALLAMASLKAVAVEKDKIEVSAEIIKIMGAYSRPDDELPRLDDKAAPRAADMAALASKQLPIQKDVKVGKLIEDFRAGRLKANASEKPVAPGQGLGELKPAEGP